MASAGAFANWWDRAPSPRCFMSVPGANASSCSKPTPTCRWPRSTSTRPRSRAPSGQARELRRVEVECIHADPGALSPVGGTDARPLRSCSQWKLPSSAPGSRSPDSRPLTPSSLGSTEISPTQLFADAQLATLRRYFAAAFAKEAEVRAGSATAVHEMRVAARHIDVLLRVFRGYGPTWAVQSRGRVRGLIKALGAVRDCDVHIGFLDKALTSLVRRRTRGVRTGTCATRFATCQGSQPAAAGAGFTARAGVGAGLA